MSANFKYNISYKVRMDHLERHKTMSSATGFPVLVFGWFTLPNLVSPNEEARKFFLNIHTWLSYALIATIAVHIAAALSPFYSEG